MECDKCGDEAVMHATYSGMHLCEEHFCRSVDSRVRKRVREDALLSEDASPDDPETWLIGLSGGKDSVVLTHILDDIFARDPRVKLVALTIHEGIEGYRDASLDACLELTDDLSIEHEVVAYADEYGLQMDDVADEDPLDMAPCAYCGVFRRDALSQYAEEYGADKLLTGHNLDDEAQTAMMNLLSGDIQQVAKHFDASLGSFEDREIDDDPFVPRAKPLRDIPEKEVALYAHLKDLPTHMAECPHASEAYRGEIQGHIHDLENDHPGTRHSIMSGYEELAKLAAEAYRNSDDGPRGECERCGAPTNNEVCRKCELVDAVGGELAETGD
ncbi:tRNA 2-thiolation protein NcsA [Natronomonas amylolytica]|uniref:tRNA 2-thiolation protein NcsA n=1 Tax=Natronomonas amylolytica TaxID=3108498 RepID=UPI00300842D5